MVEYLGGVTSSLLSTIFIAFLIAALGYLVGAIEIKGISLGTAGVLLMALAFGILANFVPSFSIGEKEIFLFNSSIESNFKIISNIGTALFVTSVGLIAGPKFFRTLNRKSLSYVLMGVIVIAIGAGAAVLCTVLDPNLSPDMAVGLLTGGLTSTPGLSAAKEVATNESAVTAGYGIAYLFGVLGVVLFVQLMPKILRVDIDKERENFVAAATVEVKSDEKPRKALDPFGFFPFFLAIALGCVIGAIKIPGINFSLGTSGGTLVAGLLIGHFGHIGPIDCRIKKETLNFFRELGLVLFLIGAGVPGGVNFVSNVKVSYFLYGALFTLVPMIVGFVLGKFVFKLSIFNNLGSITGGMTSTPALGALISTAKTDEVSSAYAATYPIALVMVVLAAKIILMIF
ncbi:MAG: YidE/YbjL duplication [Ruminococcaceae bacterium]|nr:YidE/YbjL duplication [Oscillospiraceae bacterium]